jgi:dihydrofolate reductase
MGRVTYESIVDRIGGPLPNRTNIVLTNTAPEPCDSSIIANSINEAIDEAERTGADRAYVAGGKSIYDQFLHLSDRLIITKVLEKYDGDTYWPGHQDSKWTKVSERELTQQLRIVELIKS